MPTLTPEKIAREAALASELKRIGAGRSLEVGREYTGGTQQDYRDKQVAYYNLHRLRDILPYIDVNAFYPKADPLRAGDHSPSVSSFGKAKDELLSLGGRDSSGDGKYSIPSKKVPTLQFTTDEFYSGGYTKTDRNAVRGRGAHTLYTTLRELGSVGEQHKAETTFELLNQTLSAYSGFNENTQIERSPDGGPSERKPLEPSYRVRVYDHGGRNTLDRPNYETPRMSVKPSLKTPAGDTVGRHGQGVAPFIAQAMINMWYRTELTKFSLQTQETETGVPARQVRSPWDTPTVAPDTADTSSALNWVKKEGEWINTSAEPTLGADSMEIVPTTVTPPTLEPDFPPTGETGGSATLDEDVPMGDMPMDI